jgi:hypothetical protein
MPDRNYDAYDQECLHFLTDVDRIYGQARGTELAQGASVNLTVGP